MVNTRNNGVVNRSYCGEHISSLSSVAGNKSQSQRLSETGSRFTPTNHKQGKKKSLSVGGDGKDTNVFEFLASDDVPSPCKMCNQSVTHKQKALLCGVCKFWVHLHCCNVTPEQYKFLESDSNDEFDWSCKKCKEQRLISFPTEGTAIEHNIRMDDMQHLLKVVMQQNELILRLLQNENRLEERIKTHVTEALDAQKEKVDRKDNLIVFNVPESTSKNETACKDHDDSELVNILRHVDPDFDFDKVQKDGVMRLGNKRVPSAANPSPKPRPIRIRFSDGVSRNKILTNARSLAGSKFSKIGISADKTKFEREAETALRKEWKARKDNGEDVVRFRGKVILKAERDAILSGYHYQESEEKEEEGAVGGDEGLPGLC